MGKVLHNSPETEVIRNRMEEVRGDLDTGFQGIVDDARDIGDWTYYVKTYPWAALSVALVAGYLIAPQLGFGFRRQNRIADRASGAKDLPASAPLPPTSSTSSKVLATVGNLVMRGVTAYVVHQADRFIADRLIDGRGTTSDQNDHL